MSHDDADRLMQPLFSGAGMRELDRRTIEERGIAGAVLMEEAGRACWREVAAMNSGPGRLVVVAGKGNNGGDGFVVARLATEAGWIVVVLTAVGPDELRGDAAAMFALLPMAIRPMRASEPGELAGAVRDADVIVDALLGTGGRGAPRAPFDAWIAAMNAARRPGIPIVAIDLPSGLDADGATTRADLERDDRAVRADLTITIGAPKYGLALAPGRESAGRVIVAPINFPPDLLAAPTPDVRLMSEASSAALLPARPAEGHKGTLGRAVIVAGSPAYGGAAVLATCAAMRSGAGYVFTCCDAVLHGLLLAAAPEAIVREVPTTLAPLQPSAVAIGPGLGDDEARLAATLSLLVEALEGAPAGDGNRPAPVVLDADGLRLLTRLPGAAPRRAPLILTPHPGELARLMDTSVAAIQADRLAAARSAAKRFGATVVLKGATSVIAHADGRLRVNPTGNTGLAKAGSGDVLTGLIVGLAAQGAFAAGGASEGAAGVAAHRAAQRAAERAAELGVFVHGLAADLLALRSHPRAMVAGDLAGAFGDAFRHLEAVARQRALARD
jgi:NAD(P)H-hydrate epimerase